MAVARTPNPQTRGIVTHRLCQLKIGLDFLTRLPYSARMEKDWKAFNKSRRDKGLPQVSYTNYMKHYRNKEHVRSNKSLYTTTAHRESPKVPSGDMFDKFKGSKKP